jgi:3'-phosphoadenosine 5'-phosphosulfate sulfotransferase (PAPS reductase)/FAD synthetase
MERCANVVSVSGGKDSTAMLLMMLERGEPIADIVFFDGGWEFPQMREHLEQLEQFTGQKITRLRPRLPVGVVTEKSPFDWLFSEYPIIKRGTDQVHKIGRGWPAPKRRWCTGCKQDALKAHLLALTHREGVVLPLRQCIGFASDERERLDGPTKRDGIYHVQRYPLVEWGVTEADALSYCTKRGFTWGGLYRFFSRVSCFCCPLQSLHDLRTLRRHFPALWQRMLAMESWLPQGDIGRRFNHSSVSCLENRFYGEDAEYERQYEKALCGIETPQFI